MKRTLTILLVLAALAAPARADDDDDHERARRAREAGEIVSLATVLSQVEASFAGQVVEVELERDDGKWVYAIELLTGENHIIELTYDAATARLLETEGRGVEKARKTK